MSGPDENNLTIGDVSNDKLISPIGENTAASRPAARNLQKSKSERFKNSEDISTTTCAPRRTSSKNTVTSKVKNLSTELSEPSRAAKSKRSPACDEEPKQVTYLGNEGRSSVLKADVNSTLAEERTTAEKLEDSKKECKQLRDQLLLLQKDLNDTQDFVFSLQRREQTITEADAAAEFHSLCMIVEEWVQTQLGEAFDNKSIKATPHLPRIRKFLSLIPQPGKEAFKYPDTDEYNVIAAIMKFLCHEIFDKDFYCPIERGAMDFLTSIERSMRNLEPRRDLIALRTWRCETFTAITQQPQFAKCRQSQSEMLSKDLAGMLKLFLPRSDYSGLFHSVQSTMIEPALQLAHKMHLSVNEFSLRYTPYHRTKAEDRRPLPRESSPFDCVTLSPLGRVLKFPISEGILTYLFDLSPELVFRAVKADSFAEPRVLKRARVLVALTNEEQGPYIGPSSRSREPPTFLGLVDEIIHAKLSGSRTHLK